jgi:hypothetical protein
MPENTVYVGRGSKWGNPYDWRECPPDIGPPAWARGAAVEAFRDKLLRGYGERDIRFTIDDVRRELRGKNLACWCPPDHPCHADVLLGLANDAALSSPRVSDNSALGED